MMTNTIKKLKFKRAGREGNSTTYYTCKTKLGTFQLQYNNGGGSPEFSKGWYITYPGCKYADGFAHNRNQVEIYINAWVRDMKKGIE